MGRKGVGRWKHNSKDLGHYSSVVSGGIASIELSHVNTSHFGVDAQGVTVRRSDSDIYCLEDGGEVVGDEIESDEESLEDAYEVYAVHAAYKASIKMGAMIALAVIIVLPSVILGVIHFVREFSEPKQIRFPSNELFGEKLKNGSDESIPPPYKFLEDFRNDENVPPYWEEIESIVENSTTQYDMDSLFTFSEIKTWGPCYPSKYKHGQSSKNQTGTKSQYLHINWTTQVLDELPHRYDNDLISFPSQKFPTFSKPPPSSRFFAGNDDRMQNPELSGLCRPGFLIIGQGKCGTSSLYHYLIGHPRVLPASEKQIDYFKYYSFLPMDWYLSHFPPVETFLGRGALLTGESSPSYLPYPKVPHLIYERMRVDKIKNSESLNKYPSIIALVRDPISRAKSSYEYSYVQPALDWIVNRTARVESLHPMLKKIPHGKSESYYRENHLFSFEEFARAELDVLRDCLKPGGLAELKSREKYGPPDGMFADAFTSRDTMKENESFPLINADEFCYGERINSTVPLAQWEVIVQQYPEKIIDVYSIQLVRSIIGRGLYVLFLDWWYQRFPKEKIYIICTEDLRDYPAETMAKVSSYLGLPEFDFKNVTSEGMYNVGFHTGYDTITSWEEVQEKSVEEIDDNVSDAGYNVELSEELEKELKDFYEPYNERLYQMTDANCNW
ncbi:hypothetical protein ACHAXS_004180 [Conticribra weissflogii]